MRGFASAGSTAAERRFQEPFWLAFLQGFSAILAATERPKSEAPIWFFATPVFSAGSTEPNGNTILCLTLLVYCVKQQSIEYILPGFPRFGHFGDLHSWSLIEAFPNPLLLVLS